MRFAMTLSSTDAAADPEKYLGGILDELTAAPTRDEATEVVTRAARELAGCDGWYLLPHAHAGESADPSHTLIVPLHEDSGHGAVGFFWQPWRTADHQSTRNLELLAKILGLAGRMWHADEQHAIELHDERRTASELQHRLRNNLALMRSVIRRSNETAESAEEFALHLDARIGALVRTQGMLGVAGVSSVELEELVRSELIASAVADKCYRVEGPPVRLHAKAAESLGLALHELATNSLKFGALAVENGFLAVTWTVSGLPAPELHLSWIESGVTIVSLAPRRRGFGQELIECTLPYELEARTRLTFTPGGASCTIDIPLQACAVELEIPPTQAANAGGAW
jgi:two-component sensor histidine kinase